MARPTKKGVDQLLLDVGIFGDSKIRILLSRYHADGLGVYMYILCDVYKEGYAEITCVDSDSPNVRKGDIFPGKDRHSFERAYKNSYNRLYRLERQF